MRLLPILLSLAALAAAPRAQSVYGVQGPNSLVVEMTGPSVSACAYPNGPVASAFNYAVPPMCGGQPSPLAFVPGGGLTPLAGDVAIDRERDIVFVTDGLSIASYKASTGAMLTNYSAAFLGLAPPLTGLGFDGTRRWLWISNAFGYAALEPNGTCAPIPQVAFMPAPAGLGFLTDIDIDPVTGQLWVCDDAGIVAHFAPGAGAVANALFVGGLPCGVLVPPLTGVAIDASSPPGTFVVTDGNTVVRLMEIGAGAFGPAIPRFELPQNCWPAPPGPPLLGLGVSARPVSYGAGMGPVLAALGEATVPSPLFTITLGGAPAGNAWFIVDFAAACPPLAIGGAPIYEPLTPAWILLGPIATPGTLTLPAALPGPAVLPTGITVHLQAVVNSGGAWSSSNALAFTTALP